MPATTAAPHWVHIEQHHRGIAVVHDEFEEAEPKNLLRHALVLHAGELGVNHHRPLATTLGSCIAVCLYEPYHHLIGMNHFMVPLSHHKDDQDGYFSGMASMEQLVNAMMKAGAQKHRLVAKAFGGGDMFGLENQKGIGQANIEFTQRWLKDDHIPLLASDFGGKWARQVVFDPINGDVHCRRISAQLAKIRELAKIEAQYGERVAQEHKKSKIDFF
ncbi:chemotaxis protein CheD [Chitinibacter sp. S2-10]|uniref:chemotaxis protein CheD n=1 Tax=Chitinibacter sp. S2-10 TaxID=3373597 RepID=UPI003977A381